MITLSIYPDTPTTGQRTTGDTIVKAKVTIAAVAGAAAAAAMLTGIAHAAGAGRGSGVSRVASASLGSRASRAAGAGAVASAPVVHVDGKVSYPSAYTSALLADSFPQVTFTTTAGQSRHTDTGVALDTLVNKASPAYPPTLKNTTNEQLRVTVTVTGASGYQVTFALGELLKNYGSHPAYLALTQDGQQIAGGPELVVPGDASTLRWMNAVREVTIGLAAVTATDTRPPAGSPVQVIDGPHTVVLSTARIAALPRETLRVSFSGMHGMESKTETGPSLLAVLSEAGVKLSPDTWVAAVGSDNYTVVVTPDEQVVGGRKLQLSQIQDGVRLAQPRLVPDGDFFGDRFAYDIVDLYVGSGPADLG
jgi:hypothetical protein